MSPSEHRPTGPARLLAPVIVLALVAVAVAVYMSPSRSKSLVAELAAPPGTSAILPDASSSAPSATPTPTKTPTKTPAKAVPIKRPVAATVVRPPTKAQILRPAAPNVVIRRVTDVVTRTATAPPAPTKKVPHCWDFTWQQDAQAAYAANLSDPYALDGLVGPYNGDGLACTTLPKDPARATSIPVSPYVAPKPTAAAKLSLASPSQNYFGVAQDGLPNGQPVYDKVDADLKKAPSAVEWFAGWDSDFNATSVRTAWSRGALPVMTWTSSPQRQPSVRPLSDYSLSKIIAGDFDDYLYKYASDIVRTDLPLAIRFDHEMNGNWFPWSAGQTAWNNSPAKFVAMWRHVWEIFQQVGANENVIWLWSPARVDLLKSTTQGISQIAADYPGDDYVDWVGATVYLRTSRTAADWATSFGNTIGQIRAVTAKPLFFAEIGAIQTDAGVDVTALKVQWIQNTIAGILADPSVVGFVWFNNVATTNGVTNDWRYTSAPAVLDAFRKAVADPRFAAGVLADGIQPA